MPFIASRAEGRKILRRVLRTLAVPVFPTVLLLLVSAPPTWAQPIRHQDLRLPSVSTGEGTLAVRVTYPGPAIGPRYHDGSPILVLAPGGFSGGGLAHLDEYAIEGMVGISFIFPGGESGGISSDGEYDYRGEGCVQALRDVLLFAGGRLGDVSGQTIQQILPLPLLTESVGLIGSSNGGPISMAALALHGADLDFVTTYVGWENPTGAQTVAIELGGKIYDCDPDHDGDGNGIPGDDGKNPYITAYGPVSVELEFDRLAWDPSYSWLAVDPAHLHPPIQQMGALFLDGNGNGLLDYIPGNPDCFDLDGNGVLEVGEDYRFMPVVSWHTGELSLYHSVEVVQAAEDAGLFDATWPARSSRFSAGSLVTESARAWPDAMATPEKAEEFWSWREATRFYGQIGAVLPDLKCLLVFNAGDHVQAWEPHPHIQQAYDGLRGQGIWCRLNPDASYVYDLLPNPPVEPVDVPANLEVSWPGLLSCHEPYGLPSPIATLAAVLEMADRAWAGNWDPDLDGVVSAAPERLAPTRDDQWLRLRVAPNPLGPQSCISWTRGMHGRISLSLYNLEGRLLGSAVRDVSTGSAPMEAVTGPAVLPRGIYFLEAQVPGAGRSRIRVVR